MLGMLVFWALVIGAVVWVIREVSDRRDGRAAAESAKAPPDRRFAAGEISIEEYRQRKTSSGAKSRRPLAPTTRAGFDSGPLSAGSGLERPVGPLLCLIDGPTHGRPWASDAARAQLRRVAAKAGVRRRFAPHQLRHAHAVKLGHEGGPAQRHPAPIGHISLGVTSIYLQGIDNAEIIAAVHAREAPMIPAGTGLRI